MGLFLYFFEHDQWTRLYYTNCTFKSTDEWSANGTPKILWGVICLTVGIFCELLYIPFMKVMSSQEFMQYSAYKLMFLLGCIDMITLPCASIIPGIQSILLIHYCTCPSFFYIVGSIGMTGWFITTFTCCIIAIDRFFELIFPNIGIILFRGKIIYFWLTLPFIYLLFAWKVSIPIIYNIKFHAEFFDPFHGSEFGGNPVFMEPPINLFNSIATVLILGLCYSILCIVITIKSIYFKNLPSLTKFQKVMWLQAWAICWEIFIVAIVYYFNDFYLFPEFLTKIEHFVWICVHGDTPIIYLLLNNSLRSKFFELIKNTFKRSKNFLVYFVSKPSNQNIMVAPYNNQIL